MVRRCDARSPCRIDTFARIIPAVNRSCDRHAGSIGCASRRTMCGSRRTLRGSARSSEFRLARAARRDAINDQSQTRVRFIDPRRPRRPPAGLYCIAPSALYYAGGVAPTFVRRTTRRKKEGKKKRTRDTHATTPVTQNRPVRKLVLYRGNTAEEFGQSVGAILNNSRRIVLYPTQEEKITRKLTCGI